MNTINWSLLAITYCLLLENCGIHAGVTLLLESKGPSTNSSALISKVKEATLVEDERTKENIILTKSKEVRDAWRTEEGDLVELRYLRENPAPKSLPVERTSDELRENFVMDSVAPHDSRTPLTYTGGARSSHRMQRTFWPFNGLFGYNYPPPPPPPFGLFGPPMLPPFGGGFGLGYAGPLAPPPPMLGLGFGF